MEISSDRRSDTSLALIHLTGPRGDSEAIQSLISILSEGIIRSSGPEGFIKGSQKAVCFTEMPLSSVFGFVERSRKSRHPYDFFGIALSKQSAWAQGARPVIYLPNEEADWIPKEHQWRHVRLEYGVVDFSHEREWRVKNDFYLNGIMFYVIVPDVNAERLIRSQWNESAITHSLGFLHINTLKEFM